MPGVCHRCKRNVYLADEKLALGRVWHNFCVSCRKCRKLLDECSAKLYQDEIYCWKCYNAICGRSDNDDEERRCGGRRGGCCRRCPTPARIPARAKPSPTAVTTWYSRGHSMQPCKGCPRCVAKEPWFVCEGGSQRCPDGIGCKRQSRPRTRTSSCDETCPARESLESVPSGSQEKICAPPKVVKETKPTPPNVCCLCCGRERPRRKSCCRRCHRPEKSDEERECRPRSRRSCDRATCCSLRTRRRTRSPCSVPVPPCLPCPPSDEERESSRRRRSCDRSTCCSWRSRGRNTSPSSTAAPPCIPCSPPSRRKTPDPPCLPCPPCNPIPPCNSCPPYTSNPPSLRPKTPEPIYVPCPASRPQTPEPPCKPCRTLEPPCRPCKPPEPPCRPCRTPEPPCRPCRPCRPPEPPCKPCRPPEPPCRPCPAKCKTDGVEVLCPPSDSCRCTCCCGRRRGRSCTSSDRSSMVSSCCPCPASKPRCCRNDLPIGRPCRRCGRCTTRKWCSLRGPSSTRAASPAASAASP